MGMQHSDVGDIAPPPSTSQRSVATSAVGRMREGVLRQPPFGGISAASKSHPNKVRIPATKWTRFVAYLAVNSNPKIQVVSRFVGGDIWHRLGCQGVQKVLHRRSRRAGFPVLRCTSAE